MQVLFDVAKHFSPSIIFIDEVDGMMSKRDATNDHEASKRFKNELLTQIDGLEEMRGVFLLASTNLPWCVILAIIHARLLYIINSLIIRELDSAFLRRFERKLMLGLPDLLTRVEMIRQLLSPDIKANGTPQKWSNEVLNQLAELSEGFSGDELRIAFKEATMGLIRQAINSTNKSND